MKRDMSKLGGALLLAGALQFALVLVAAESARHGYSASSNYISDLGVGHLAILFNASVLLLGALAVLGALCLFRPGEMPVLPLLIVASGFGALGVGIFPETTGLPHLAFSIAAFTFGFLAALYHGATEKGAFRYVSLLLGLTSCAALVLSGAGMYLWIGPGGMERMIAYPILLWLTAFGARKMGA